MTSRGPRRKAEPVRANTQAQRNKDDPTTQEVPINLEEKTPAVNKKSPKVPYGLPENPRNPEELFAERNQPVMGHDARARVRNGKHERWGFQKSHWRAKNPIEPRRCQ